MLKYITKRLLMLIPVLLGVSLMVFVVMHVFSADPTSSILGEHATQGQIVNLREQLGLNKPLYVQYFDFFKGALKGDLGSSLVTHSAVAEDLAKRLPATIELAVAAILIASVVGVTIGIISAVKRNSIIDYLSMLSALVGVSMPIFWLGLILIVVFSVTLHWLPVSGRASIGMEPVKITGLYMLDSLLSGNMASFWDSLKHIIMPAIALSSYSTAIIARMTRSTMIEILSQDYIRTARAKGLFEKTIIYGHALRNALITVVTVIGLQLGGLLGGAVLTETVFSWPGLGSYTIEAILRSDYPVVQGSVIMFAAIFVIVNLVVDLLYAYLDPRIKYS